MEVYQPVLLAEPAAPPVLGHYRHLVGLPRLINLVGGQLAQHEGTATNTPMLYLPPEVLALPDDPEERQKLPLNAGLLTRTEGEALEAGLMIFLPLLARLVVLPFSAK